MKKIEEVLDNLKNGSIININKSKNNSYEGSITRYDGKIIKDVNSIEVGNFLNYFPNICSRLDKNHIYRMSYDYIKDEYTNVILKKSEDLKLIEIGLISCNDNLLEGIIELDTIIANLKNKSKVKKYK